MDEFDKSFTQVTMNARLIHQVIINDEHSNISTHHYSSGSFLYTVSSGWRRGTVILHTSSIGIFAMVILRCKQATSSDKTVIGA